MPSYKYRVIYENGKIGRGRILAKNKAHAIESLKNDNVQPILVKKQKDAKKKFKRLDYKKLRREQLFKEKEKRKSKPKVNFKDLKFNELAKIEIHPFSRVSNKDIISFVNNLYILKKSKFNNVQALETLYEGIENPRFKEIIEDILIGVQSGERLYKVMAEYPSVFPPIFINFIKVGEESGNLDDALLHARDYVESNMSLKKKIRAAIIPRVLQFVGIIALMFVAVLVGVPILQDVYDMFDSTQEIPAATMWMLNFVKWLGANWYIIVGALLAIFLVWFFAINTTRGKYNWDKFLLLCPVIGDVNKNITINKFFLAMLLNLKNGQRIQEALEVSKSVSSNYYFLSTVELAKSNAMAGENWITPFEDNKLFKPMVSQMVGVGMKTDLAEMMEKVNMYIKQEIDESVARFVKVLPDITYLFVGIALIAFVITVVVPVVNVYMGSFIDINAY